MRDNSDGYPEILDAYERDGHYFGVIRIARESEWASFEFGVTQSAFFSLKRILGHRPFDSTPGIPYSYFFTGSFTGAIQPDQQVFTFDVFVEQGQAKRKFEFKGPKSLLANLLWFLKTKSIDEAAPLKRIE